MKSRTAASNANLEVGAIPEGVDIGGAAVPSGKTTGTHEAVDTVFSGLGSPSGVVSPGSSSLVAPKYDVRFFRLRVSDSDHNVTVNQQLFGKERVNF